MKFTGQPKHYWMVQRREKSQYTKTGNPGSWGICHKSKVYWTYDVATGAMKEYEKLGKGDSYFKMFEYRIVRLEVIGVEEIFNQIKQEQNEKQLKIENDNEEGFDSRLSSGTKFAFIDTILNRISKYIQRMASKL